MFITIIRLALFLWAYLAPYKLYLLLIFFKLAFLLLLLLYLYGRFLRECTIGLNLSFPFLLFRWQLILLLRSHILHVQGHHINMTISSIFCLLFNIPRCRCINTIFLIICIQMTVAVLQFLLRRQRQFLLSILLRWLLCGVEREVDHEVFRDLLLKERVLVDIFVRS